MVVATVEQNVQVIESCTTCGMFFHLGGEYERLAALGSVIAKIVARGHGNLDYCPECNTALYADSDEEQIIHIINGNVVVEGVCT